MSSSPRPSLRTARNTFPKAGSSSAERDGSTRTLINVNVNACFSGPPRRESSHQRLVAHQVVGIMYRVERIVIGRDGSGVEDIRVLLRVGNRPNMRSEQIVVTGTVFIHELHEPSQNIFRRGLNPLHGNQVEALQRCGQHFRHQWLGELLFAERLHIERCQSNGLAAPHALRRDEHTSGLDGQIRCGSRSELDSVRPPLLDLIML